MAEEQLEELTAGLGGMDEVISDLHLDEITGSHLENWRSLPSRLELDEIAVSDIKRDYRVERERRKGLLMLWKERKGNGATYRILVAALLRIACRQDAEYIVTLLRRDQLQPPTHSAQQADASDEASGSTSSEGLQLDILDKRYV